MIGNSVRSGIDSGRTVFGTFVMEFATPGIAPMADAAGAEFIFWDLQHTGWSLSDVSVGLASARSLDIVPGVRVPSPEASKIGAALDLGAQLIMVPAVDDAETARQIVDAARYPVAGPRSGHRAVTFNFASDGYRPPADVAGALREANDNVVIFAQIETAAGLENVEEIAEVDGIDVLWVGDNDLAASIGTPGDFASEPYLSALDRVAAAAKKANKYAGFTTTDPTVAAEMLARGYRILAFGNDIKVFKGAISAGVSEFERLAANDRA